MTGCDEQRVKLAKVMATACQEPHWTRMLAALDAIGAAGACVVWPDATGEMVHEAWSAHAKDDFRLMALKGNLAGAEK